MKKASYWAVVYLFALSAGLHFAYELLPVLPVAAVCPVNESVWEHLKLAYFPLVVWWMIYGFKTGLPLKHRLLAGLVSSVSACLFIVAVHYVCKGAFGSVPMVLDILSLAGGMALGQYLANLALEWPHCGETTLLSALALAVLGMLLIYFTFYPPRIPLFQDAESGGYGIQHQFRE